MEYAAGNGKCNAISSALIMYLTCPLVSRTPPHNIRRNQDCSLPANDERQVSADAATPRLHTG